MSALTKESKVFSVAVGRDFMRHYSNSAKFQTEIETVIQTSFHFCSISFRLSSNCLKVGKVSLT